VERDQRALLADMAMTYSPYSRKREIEIVVGLLNGSKIVVDAGGGTGWLASQINGETILVDQNKMAVELARKKGLNIVSSSLENISLESNIADAVVSLGVLHHCDDLPSVFSEFNRILKDNGKVVIADVTRECSKVTNFFDTVVREFSITGHRHDFSSIDEITRLFFDAGFTNINTSRIFCPWEFSSKAEMIAFVRVFFGLQGISAETLFEKIQNTLGFVEWEKSVLMYWELTLFTAEAK